MAYRSFEDLTVWKTACRLSVEINEAFSDCRNFSIKDQICRSSFSVPSNIAEGSERGSPADFIRFIHIAKGSAAELRTQLYIASRLGYVDKEKLDQWIPELKKLSAQLQVLIQSLQATDPSRQKPNT